MAEDEKNYYFNEFKILKTAPSENDFTGLTSNIFNRIYLKLGVNSNDTAQINAVKGIDFIRKFIKTTIQVKGVKKKSESPVEYKISLTGNISKKDYIINEQLIQNIKKLGIYAALPLELQFAFITKDKRRSAKGTEKILSEGDIVYSDDEFRFIVQPNQDCYLYIFNIDSSDKLNQIFPVESKINIINPIRRGNRYIIPPDLVYAFDDVKGKELFYVFAFKNEVTDFTEIEKKIKNKPEQKEEAVSKNEFNTKCGNYISRDVRGTKMIKSKDPSFLGSDKLLPDILTGPVYIMRVIDLEHK